MIWQFYSLRSQKRQPNTHFFQHKSVYSFVLLRLHGTPWFVVLPSVQSSYFELLFSSGIKSCFVASGCQVQWSSRLSLSGKKQGVFLTPPTGGHIFSLWKEKVRQKKGTFWGVLCKKDPYVGVWSPGKAVGFHAVCASGDSRALWPQALCCGVHL